MGNISDRVKAELTGTTLKAQADAKKAHPVTDDDGATITASNDAVIKVAANAVKGGTQVDKGSQLIEDMKIAAKALSVTTTGRTSRITQAELDAEVGYPNPQGAEAIAAIQRINRRGEPQGGK